jgi:hypothetical protein
LKTKSFPSFFLFLATAIFLLSGCGEKGSNSKPVYVSGIFQKEAAIQAHINLKAANESVFSKKIREAYPEQQKQIDELVPQLQDFLTVTGLQMEDFAEFALMFGSLDFALAEKGVSSFPQGIPFAFAFKVTGEVPLETVLKFIEEEGGEDVDLAEIRKNQTEFENAAILTVPIPEEKDQSMLVAHKIHDGATYVLLGDETTIKGALSSGRPGKPSEGSGIQTRLLPEKIAWLAVEFPDGLLDKGKKGLEKNPMLKGVTGLLGKIKALGLSGNITDTFPIQVRLAFADEESASQGAAALNGILGLFRLGALQRPESIPPFFNKLTVAADKIDLVVEVELSLADVEYVEKMSEKGE